VRGARKPDVIHANNCQQRSSKNIPVVDHTDTPWGANTYSYFTVGIVPLNRVSSPPPCLYSPSCREDTCGCTVPLYEGGAGAEAGLVRAGEEGEAGWDPIRDPGLFLVIGGSHKARKRYTRDVVSTFSKEHHFWCSKAFSLKPSFGNLAVG
jgi:hypothetical protein